MTEVKMNKVAFFDLDGTLLPVDLDFFFKSYIKAVTPWFKDLIQEEIFVKALLESTYDMIDDLDPSLTNQDAFARSFAPKVGYPWETLWPIFQNFYDQGFGQLEKLVPKRSTSRRVLMQLLEKGWKVVLATNPIFPEKAIRERMSWCQIHDLPWLYVTTMENSHFCKPHLEYYEEICRVLGLDPRSCVMVGNDVQEDMVARKLGMKTFLVEEFMIDRGSGEMPDFRGGLEDVPGVLENLVSGS